MFGFKDTTLTGVGEINSSFTIITILGIKKQVKCLHVEHAGRHGVIRYIVTAAPNGHVYHSSFPKAQGTL